jgi:hypothetical protein
MLLGLGSVRGEGVGETLGGRSRVSVRGVVNGGYSIDARSALVLGTDVADDVKVGGISSYLASCAFRET